MSKIKVEWGTYKFRGDPEKVYKEISDIGNEVKPEDIVAYAKQNPSSELHKCFTWNDGEAARKWRLQEARLIVCNIVTSQGDGNNEPEKVRLLMQTEKTGGYKQLTYIIQNQGEFEKMMERALEELNSFSRKYHTLRKTKLNGVFAAIDAV